MPETIILDSNEPTIAAAIAQIPSGCSILTVEHEGQATGVLVSWVQQASFKPLMISICLREGRPAFNLVQSSKHFLLNVLGDNASAMFRHFGRGFALEDDAFAGLNTESTEFGRLLCDCPAQLACRLIQSVPSGDHTLIIAEVVAGRVQPGSKPYTHIRRSALNY